MRQGVALHGGTGGMKNCSTSGSNSGIPWHLKKGLAHALAGMRRADLRTRPSCPDSDGLLDELEPHSVDRLAAPLD